MTDASEMTVFEIVFQCGPIVLADEDTGMLFAWNGSLTFHAFQHAAQGRFYVVDAWTMEEAPKELDAAVEKCRERLSAAIADAGD